MQLLDYENQIFLDLLHEDGLAIMAKGLGIEKVMLNLLKVHNDPGNLVVVIGTTPQEEEFFMEQLEAESINPKPKAITTAYGTNERYEIYMEGGTLFVTSRILVVDMLMERIPIDLITGIIVYKAHKIMESCQEAFILRLFRQKNKNGFIKALSCSPVSFTQGFCHVQRMMRNLFVRKLYLWPRFHADVNSCLEKKKPEVIELHISMTSSMQAIQMSLLDLMNFCIRELKKLNSTLDTDELTVENAISRSFDKVIRLQLEPFWHQLSGTTRRLVSDLKILRTILIYLTQYNCVTFYSLLKSIRDSTTLNTQISDWLFLDAAQSLFQHAKERVFGRDSKARKAPEKNNCELKLEDDPKWLALSEILAELKEETKDEISPSPILVVVEDDRTSGQLTEFLSEGSQEYLTKLYNKTVKQPSEDLRITELSPQKRKKAGSKQTAPSPRQRKKTRPTRKKKVGLTLTQMAKNTTDSDSKTEDMETSSQSNPEDSDHESEAAICKESSTYPITLIHPLRGSNDPFRLHRILQRTMPRYIIMYDSAIPVVRQLEVFQASHPELCLRVYFLIYRGSSEEQRYLTALRKEKDAFEFLIREKSTMVIPEDRDGRGDDHPDLIRDVTPANETVSTRKAAQPKPLPGCQKVIVDMREFRSELPSLIHRRGIDIEPVTIEVGDYILTPDTCVERKSLNDLVGSLNSGRLYNQAHAMCRYYRRPILLIEFDQNKSFSLQGKYYLSRDSASQNIVSKLILLTMHFPRLRLLWCASPYSTAEMFELLKVGKDEPVASEALAITEKESCGNVSSEKYNADAQDALSKLPGINSKNIRSVMNKVTCIADLISLSVEQLTEILGSAANATLLHDSLHKPISRLEKAQLNTRLKPGSSKSKFVQME